jgi:DNA-binding NarL/FixJ family response regulator
LNGVVTELDRARTSNEQEEARPIRVVVISSYPAVRAGLMSLLEPDTGFAIRAGSGASPLDAPETADVIVLDITHDERDIEQVVEQYHGVPLVLIGGDPDIDLVEPADAPVAYLSPSVESASLIAAVHAVKAGLIVIDPEFRAAIGLQSGVRPVVANEAADLLTPREHEVLRLVAAGLPNKTIARELGISEHTAKFHVGSLLAKLNAGSRTEAVTIATRRGLLTI